MEEPMGEKDVTDVYGVGEEAARKLKELGILKAWQLVGYMLIADKEDILEFLKKHGVAAMYAKKVAWCLLMNYKYHNF